jgi:Lar family restriction alleviation protein
MNELKKCPFCGNEITILYDTDDSKCFYYWICSGCEIASRAYGSEEEVITAVNTRIHPVEEV